MSDSQPRRSWVSLGEFIALCALLVSALGVWIAWKSSGEDKPTRVVEQNQPIPLILRGSAESDGRTLAITPVETDHALESLTVTIPAHAPIELGSDGRLSASDVETALKDDKDRKGVQKVRVTIAARYVEMGKERHATGTYMLRYRWEGGGLFGGRSVRLEGLSR
jgi:hypothetical protein